LHKTAREEDKLQSEEEPQDSTPIARLVHVASTPMRVKKLCANDKGTCVHFQQRVCRNKTCGMVTVSEYQRGIEYQIV
jgi:hypothetical protein